LTQPWASLVAFGEKTVESRSWPTPYRGLLAVHAGRTVPGWARGLGETEPFASALRRHGVRRVDRLPGGAVVGLCRLVDCVAAEALRPTLAAEEHAFGDYADGRWGFVLRDAVALAPIPLRGMLGVFSAEIDDDVVRAALGSVPS